MPYTYSRPTAFPDYATDDVNNGLAGAPNVQEPPLGKKQQGHDYGEKPPREFLNWIHRTTNNWLKYADERVTALLDLMDGSKSKTAEDADNYFRGQW